MIVKIGDKIYKSTEIPIMIIFSAQAKKNIRSMSKKMFKYCEYPDNNTFSPEDIKKFMGVDE